MGDTIKATSHSIECADGFDMTLREAADFLFAETGVMPVVVTVDRDGNVLQKAVPADTLPEYHAAASDASADQ